MIIPTFDPHTAITNIYGYAMYAHNGKPWIVHSYTVRISDGKGAKVPVKRVEHLQLDADAGWGDTKVAGVVRKELQKQWDSWVDWNNAMKGK